MIKVVFYLHVPILSDIIVETLNRLTKFYKF